MAGEVRTRIVIDADTGNAVRALDELSQTAEQLDRDLSDELTVDVDTVDAQRNLSDVVDAADDVDRALADTPRLDVDVDTGKVDAAEAEVRALRNLADDPVRLDVDVDPAKLDRVRRSAGDLEDVTETAQRGVGPLRGFTDELGGAAGEAGVLGNAVIDAGEAVQIFGTRIGLSEQATQRLATGLTAAAGVVAAATFVWQTYRSEQERVTERKEELLGVTEALTAGNYEEAASTLLASDTWRTLFTELSQRGVSAADTVAYLRGETDDLNVALSDGAALQLDALRNSWKPAEDAARLQAELTDAYTAALTGNAGAQERNRTALASSVLEMDRLRGSTADTTGAVDDLGNALDENREGPLAEWKAALDIEDQEQRLSDALNRFQTEAAEAWQAGIDGAEDHETQTREAEDALDDLERQVYDYITALEGVPDELVTRVRAALDSGSIEDIQRELANARFYANVTARLNVDRNDTVILPSGGAVPGPSNVTVNLNASADMRDVDAAVNRWGRINGGG